MTTPAQHDTRVLLISGSGRSGTTILSVLLSQGEGLLNIGQLRDIWEGWQTVQPCTCGQTVCDCVLWGQVRQDILAEYGADLLERAQAALALFMSDAAQLTDWNDRAGLARLARDHGDMLALLTTTLQTLARRGLARTLIDSSKSPEFALAVHLTGQFDCHVLNMVRDPRAVAVSWKRKKAGRIGRKLDAWKARQDRLTGWADAPGLTHLSLSYEAFVADPVPALERILAGLGETLPTNLFIASHQAQVSWNRQHLFPPSNERVLAERADRVVIRAPQDWRAMRFWGLHLRALLRSFPAGPAYVLGLGKRTNSRDI